MKQTEEKRPYFRKADKDVIRADILSLQEKAKQVSTVPARVVNGSHQDAVEFKENVAALMADRRVAGGLGESLSGRQLLEVKASLEAKLAKVLH